MKRIAVIVALALSFIAGTMFAQASLQPTDVQKFRLQLDALDIQKAAILWQQKAQTLPEYVDYQKAQTLLRSDAESFKVANGWAKSVEFNDASLSYFDSAVKPEAKK